MIDRATIKAVAKKILEGKWGNSVLAVFLSQTIPYAGNIAIAFAMQILLAILLQIIGVNLETLEVGNEIAFIAIFLLAIIATILLCIIIQGPFILGQFKYFSNLVNDNNPQTEDIFYGFKTFKKSLPMAVLPKVLPLLWGILFIIPGIVKAMAYSMSYLVYIDNPDIKPMDALKKSEEITSGYKMELFIFYLSFLGWVILGMCICGIGIFWVNTYFYTSLTCLYNKMKEESKLSSSSMLSKE